MIPCDDKKIESSYKGVYIKENASPMEKPLILWLSERIGKNLPADETNRPQLLKLLKNLISAEQKLKRKKKEPTINRPISTAQVSISPDSFPKNSSPVRESKSLKDAYTKVYLKEETEEFDPLELNEEIKNLLSELDNYDNE